MQAAASDLAQVIADKATDPQADKNIQDCIIAAEQAVKELTEIAGKTYQIQCDHKDVAWKQAQAIKNGINASLDKITNIEMRQCMQTEPDRQGHMRLTQAWARGEMSSISKVSIETLANMVN